MPDMEFPAEVKQKVRLQRKWEKVRKFKKREVETGMKPGKKEYGNTM